MSSFNTICFCWFPMPTPSSPCSCPTVDPSTLSGHLSAFMAPVSHCVPVPFFYFYDLCSSTPWTHCNTCSYAQTRKMWARTHTEGRDRMCDFHLSEPELLCLILYPFSFKVMLLFFFTVESNSIVYLCHNFITYSTTDTSALPPLPYYSE